MDENPYRAPREQWVEPARLKKLPARVWVSGGAALFNTVLIGGVLIYFTRTQFATRGTYITFGVMWATTVAGFIYTLWKHRQADD